MVQCFVFLGSRLELTFVVAGAVHTCQVWCVDAVCLGVPEVWRLSFFLGMLLLSLFFFLKKIKKKNHTSASLLRDVVKLSKGDRSMIVQTLGPL